MGKLVLKTEIVDKIKADPILCAKVAVALGVELVSMPRILNENRPSLAQATVLKVLREELKVKQDNKLLIEMQAA